MAITASADHHYFLRNGTPTLLWSESAWALMTQPSFSDVQFFLDDVSARGVNCLNVQLISRRGDSAPNTIAGVAPFTTPGNLATVNSTYLAYAASVIDQMIARGMICILFPGYLGNGHPSDLDDGWGQILDSEGATKVSTYAAAVATYFASRTANIIWGFGGDTVPDSFSSVNALYDGVRSVDTTTPATAHWSNGFGGIYSRAQTQRAWYDLDVIYDWDQTAVAGDVNGRYGAGLNPSMLFEGRYEHNGITTKELRVQCIASMLGGACGCTFGNESIWHFSATNIPTQSNTGIYWKSDLDTTPTRQYAYAKTLFATRQWWTTSPDDASALITSSRGSGTSFIWGRYDSSLAYIYTPAGSGFSLDMSKFSRRVSAYWFDPTAGTYTAMAGAPFSATGTRSFTTPGNNSAGDSDWVALLELETLTSGVSRWMPPASCPVRR